MVPRPATSANRNATPSAFERLAIALRADLDLEAEPFVPRERAGRVLGIDTKQCLLDAALAQLDERGTDERTREPAPAPRPASEHALEQPRVHPQLLVLFFPDRRQDPTRDLVAIPADLPERRVEIGLGEPGDEVVLGEGAMLEMVLERLIVRVHDRAVLVGRHRTDLEPGGHRDRLGIPDVAVDHREG